MNILFLTTHFDTGGITSYILTLAKEFKKKGHGVWVVSSGGNMTAALEGAGAVHVTLNIRTKSELNPKIYFCLPKIKKLIGENNITVIHTHTRVTQVMGTLLARQTGALHVTTCHGFFTPKLARRILPGWGQKTIAISVSVKDHLIKDLNVSAGQISLVSSGLDLVQFAVPSLEERAVKRREFGIKDEPVIGIIARLSGVKGHDTLIRAMTEVVKEVPNALLMIVGEGKIEGELKNLTQELGLKEHIKFFPIVDRTARMLSVFDIFVMPSLQEGLGLSIMEAQAVGLPVVASKVGGIPSLIENGKTGILIDPQDPAQLAAAIVNLIKNPAQAKALGLAARQFIEKSFSAADMADKTLEVYRAG